MRFILVTLFFLAATWAAFGQTTGPTLSAAPQPNNIGNGAIVSGDSAYGYTPVPGTGVPGTPSPGAPSLRVGIPEDTHPHGKRKSNDKFDPKQ